MKIKWVKQEDPCGCAVACMAMVLGITYAEVKKDFWNDFKTTGLSMEQIDEYIADHKGSSIKKIASYYNHKDKHDEEMLKPFAPVHLVSIQSRFDSTMNHCVVMDEVGKLHCPDAVADKELRKSYRISYVIGIWFE